MSDRPPDQLQLTRRIAPLPVVGVTEPRVQPHLQIKSLESAPPPTSSEEQYRNLQRLRAEARRRENELDYAQIESLGFNLFTTEEIDALSVVSINRGEMRGPHTVRDLHLGPHNESQVCETCSGDFRSCYGHYGKINIPPFMHPLALSHIIHVLGCVCNSCGGLLITEEDINKEGINRLSGLRRLQAIKELTTRLSKGCNRHQNTPGVTPCGSAMPIYGTVKDMTKSKDYKLSYVFRKGGPKYFRSPREVYKILDCISDRDAELLGFIHGSHPRAMIMERMLVIPYCARPDLMQDDVLYPDDISSIYSDIVKKAVDYFDSSKPASEKEEILKDLYFRIRHFMRNEGGEYKQGSSKVYTDITTRLQGKTALIRAHIMGKRVNFAGRTVAAPGGYLRVDEIGIPADMAFRLTRPFVVTELNRAELQADFDAGVVRNITPRAGRMAGNRIMISPQFRQDNPNYQVQIGDLVERGMKDGDIVLVNRQPTLQRQSIIALHAKVIKGRVIMINLSITSPLNADFDGDELNIHVPQTIEAYAEAEQLMSVQAGLMNEQTNQPMFGIVYNALTGAFLLTRDESTPETRDVYRQNLAAFQQVVKDFQQYQRSLVPQPTLDSHRALAEQTTNLQRTLNELDDRIRLTTTTPEELTTLEDERARVYAEYRTVDTQRIQLRAQIQEYINTNTDRAHLQVYDQALALLKDSEKKIGMLDELVFNQCLVAVADRPQFDTLRNRCEQEGVIWGTGKALASGAFPEDFYYNAKNVLIRNGILISGTLSKATIGRSDGSVIAEMYKQLNATAAVDFMSDIQFVTREYLNLRGFSVSLDDVYTENAAFEEEMQKIINEAEVKAIALAGPSANQIQAEAKERLIVKALEIGKQGGDELVIRSLKADNAFLVMSSAGAGSKGTPANIAMMTSVLGLQRVNNKRIPASMPGNRTLPIFRPGDQTPRARGFVRSSFYSGLMPDELFFHAMAGREGITDTAINTSNTGQLGHNLIKAAEDAHISGDGSVRAADGSIIQFVYGGDGFNGGELGNVTIRGQQVPFFRNLRQVADKISAKVIRQRRAQAL
jgi:DNA-directed RNA polymerase II subunit RPB1